MGAGEGEAHDLALALPFAPLFRSGAITPSLTLIDWVSPLVEYYSLRLTLGVPVEFGTGFNKCKGKLVKKDSGMWVLLFYISFIIICESKKVSGM